MTEENFRKIGTLRRRIQKPPRGVNPMSGAGLGPDARDVLAAGLGLLPGGRGVLDAYPVLRWHSGPTGEKA